MRRRFLANRAAISADELAKYAGRWVAWSPDGSRVAVSSTDPAQLDDLLRAAGEDPADCVVEGIPADGELDGEMRVNSGEWTEEKNQRRVELVHKKYDHGLTDEEETELADLQCGFHENVDRVAPLPIEEARRLYDELLQKALKSQAQ
jgi:hypothetical protein